MAYDVVIVGAGTGGCFAAYRLAKMGFSVALLDTKEESSVGDKVCGDAIGEHHFKNLGLELPRIGEDAEGVYKGVRVYAPNERDYITAPGKGYALNRLRFGQRMLKLAVDAGAEFFGGHHVSGPIVEEDWVRGVKAVRKSDGCRVDFEARVVIDASGVPGVVRSRVPEGWWVREIPPREDYVLCYREVIRVDGGEDTDYAIIYLNPDIAPGGYWWWFPKREDLVNVGIGTQLKEGNPNPRDQYEKYLRPRFEKRVVEVIHAGGGLAPTRRPLDCMVWNGLVVIGDAACTANPIHGGGIGPSMVSADKAAETIAEALGKGSASVENLWPYHIRYHRAYGAKQAALDVLRLYLQRVSSDDLNFVISKQIVGDRELLDIGYDANLRLSVLDKLGIALKLLSRPSSLVRVKTVKDYMDRVRELYLSYPSTPAEFPEWRERVHRVFEEFSSKVLR